MKHGCHDSSSRSLAAQNLDQTLEGGDRALSSQEGNSTGGVDKTVEAPVYRADRDPSQAQLKGQPQTFNMMSQQNALNSLFADDPFFSQGSLLWPLRTQALSSIQQDFFNRRAKLADSLFAELHDGPHLPLMSSAFPRLSNGDQHKDISCVDKDREVQQASQKNGDLLVTLDARGYAPSDITVKLEGRSLAVAALKQAGAEDCQSCSSSTSHAAYRSSSAAKMGFMQRIELPPHLDLTGLSCSLMDNGQLRIHAPAAKPSTGEEKEQETMQGKEQETMQGKEQQTIEEKEQEEEVLVRFRSSLEFPIRKDKAEDQTD